MNQVQSYAIKFQNLIELGSTTPQIMYLIARSLFDKKERLNNLMRRGRCKGL